MKISFRILTVAISALMMVMFSACRKTLLEPNSRVYMCKLNLELVFSLNENLYDGENISEAEIERSAVSSGLEGEIRYVVKAYPVEEGIRSLNHSAEFIFTKDISQGYNHQVEFELEKGEYELFVWCDLIEAGKEHAVHNASNFGEITVNGSTFGNSGYRESFRGNGNVTLVFYKKDNPTHHMQIQMSRPMASFEFVTTDIDEFIESEKNRRMCSSINLADYSVKFMYSGFVPDAYNIYADKPIDSSGGISFSSSFSEATETTASLGYDYIFVDDVENAVNLRIGVYAPDGTQVALTTTIRVPLIRGCCTRLFSSFLKRNSEGGVDIDTEYEGEHNVWI